MPFLQKIDELYGKIRQEYSPTSVGDDFNVFFPIEISDGKNKSSFSIRKGKKAKLLVISGKQRVYLSDYQIINTILSMDREDVQWYLKQFVLLYTGIGHQIVFSLDATDYTYLGIPAFPTDKSLLLFSDTCMKHISFCHLLNFIFAKDKCWETISHISNFSKRTLCKYISVIDYVHNKSAYSKSFLEEIKYPTDACQPVSEKVMRKLFEKGDYIEKFDISNYT